MRRSPFIRIAVLTILLAIVVACGPVSPPPLDGEGESSVAAEAAAPESAAPEGAAPASAIADAAPAGSETGNEAPALNVALETATTTAEGVPIGFTEEGYPYIGNPDAPVVMEEFSDYQCPFCARFHAQTLPALLQDQVASGDLVIVFRDFPLNIHPQAVPAANAARCAGEQGIAAYWDMHDLLFAGIASWAKSGYAAIFADYARELGLDETAFNECVTGERYADAIEADLNEGWERAVSSTPSFFLNGQPLIGAQPLAVFNEAITAVRDGGRLASAQAPTPAPAAPAVAPTPATLGPDYAASLGDPAAPVTIVEFTDYQCPFCLRHATETMPAILENLISSGRVYYILKDLPLESIHPQARLAANGARCAGNQGAYWEMHEALFLSQSEWSVDDASANAVMGRLAGEIGLDTATFEGCLSSRQFDDRVAANLDEAARLGVGGTPFFFVNGYPLNGARPYEHFEFAVDLAEEGTLAEAFVQSQPAPTPTPRGPVDVPVSGGFALGDPDAPVLMVEYTDYQCPFCQRYHDETFPQIKAAYIDTGQVYYVVKDFPLNSIHPQAALAGAAAWCAGEQEAYLTMADRLFDTQGDWANAGAADAFTGYAADLGLDETSFRECLDSGRYDAQVTANLNEGMGFGVTGTPAFFIDGNLVAGAYPFEAFAQALDQLLAGR